MNIRNARIEELDEVAQVISAAYHQYSAIIPPEQWQPYLNNLIDVRGRLDKAELIVAEEDGRILGAVTFFPDGAASTEEGWTEDYSGIRILAVPPDARGRGLGRILTEEGIRRSRELGVRYVGLHTTEFMAVAKAMYERMGFERIPEFDFKPAPQVVVMAYRLEL